MSNEPQQSDDLDAAERSRLADERARSIARAKQKKAQHHGRKRRERKWRR